MKIYLHIEILLRELDSRLLLAVLAAGRGHQVVLGDTSSLEIAAKNGALHPGVLLTKSLTPSEKKLVRHKIFLNQSILITSIDEESGLAHYLDFDTFTKQRYSADSLEQASAAFCWGYEDSTALKRAFPDASDKVFITGSPRVDLWRPRFRDYWGEPLGLPPRPFLLVSANFATGNGIERIHKIVERLIGQGNFSRDAEEFRRYLGFAAEQWRIIAAFVEAIRHLSESSPDFDIVLRPHPGEEVEAWNVFLHGLPNVHVIREGGITSWGNHAFAVMHNGCTTAFEATIAGKPVIAYVPFAQEYELEAPNNLSQRITSPDKLLSELTNLLEAGLDSEDAQKSNPQLPSQLETKIYIDDKELAAEKIIRVWESLEIENKEKKTKWFRFRLTLFQKTFRSVLKMMVRKLEIRESEYTYSGEKFPGFDLTEVQIKVDRLRYLLGIERDIRVRQFSKKVLLVEGR